MAPHWDRPLTGATILLMHPELETSLSALLDGQVKLAEGHAALVVAQQKTEARIGAAACGGGPGETAGESGVMGGGGAE